MRYTLLTFIFLQTTLFASFSANLFDINTSKPLFNATISDSTISVKSDENGSFNIDTNESALHVKAYGYRRFAINLENNSTKFYLEPITVKALYLSFWGANIYSKTMKRVLKIIDETKINAIVVDVKNEYGCTSYRTSVKQANGYGASKSRTIGNIDNFMKLMDSFGIYTIARIVTFKDELQSINNYDYAIKNKDGFIWRNHDNMGWVDPFDKRSHQYTIAIAEDAAKVGFDEVNFDYIRFPAKKALVLSKTSNQKNRTKAIENFLELAQKKLKKYGTFISVDTYGNVCWEKGDTGIGQEVESLAKYADYISPMLYPSGFASGSFGVKYPAEHPYIVVQRSIANIHGKIEPIRIRPWLQCFKDYSHTKKNYGKFEITEQIRATEDVNSSGWMMWSPSSRYHESYFINAKDQ